MSICKMEKLWQIWKTHRKNGFSFLGNREK
nr:MAG TPA: hypothetical protein [Caudoviricetes sp.]